HLHLLELARAEDEVARRDLVAEALADLGDAERGLHAGAREHVREVHEDALGGLGAQVVEPLFVVDGAEVGLEQAGERARLGPLAARAAVLADDVGEAVLGHAALLLLVGLQQVVFAVALVAMQALDERVAEDLDVTGCLPHLTRQDHGGVDAHDVVAALHHELPPLALDVLLERGAEGAVVPGGAGPAVDLTRLEDEATTLRERDDLVEGVGRRHGGAPDDRAAPACAVTRGTERPAYRAAGPGRAQRTARTIAATSSSVFHRWNDARARPARPEMRMPAALMRSSCEPSGSGHDTIAWCCCGSPSSWHSSSPSPAARCQISAMSSSANMPIDASAPTHACQAGETSKRRASGARVISVP